MGDLAVGARPDHDVPELVLGGEAALGVDRDLEAGLSGSRRRADLACSHLDVLFAQRGDHVAGGHRAGGQFLRVQPDTHRIRTLADHLHVADAIAAGQDVLDVQLGVAGQVQHVVAIVG